MTQPRVKITCLFLQCNSLFFGKSVDQTLRYTLIIDTLKNITYRHNKKLNVVLACTMYKRINIIHITYNQQNFKLIFRNLILPTCMYVSELQESY